MTTFRLLHFTNVSPTPSVPGEVLSYSHNLYDGEIPPQSTAPVAACQKQHHSSSKAKRSQLVLSTNESAILCKETALGAFLIQAKSIAVGSGQQMQSGPSHEALIASIDSSSMAYVISSNGCLVLTHRFEVPTQDNEYEGYVDALDGTIRAVADWTSPGTAGTPSLARPDFGRVKIAGTGIDEVLSAPVRKVKQWMSWNPAVEAAVAQAGSDADDESKAPSYKVFTWGTNDPSEAKRTYQPARHDPEVSPYGWHAHPSSRSPFTSSRDRNQVHDGNLTKYTDTRGNNVFVSWGGISNEDAFDPELPRPRGSVINGSRTFDYPYPWRKFDSNHTELPPREYALASQTQLWYTINEYHDMLFHYGFDGPSGNFEEYSKDGGKDGDAVIAFAQSKAGMNNADFSTPPDGRRGRMRMYTWDGHPERDGAFEEGIVIHEYTHGLSTRLTGGAADSSCLGWGESGGMGEGWGDIFATLARDRNNSDVAFSMGEWASGRPGGIRKFPYSRNITLSPETYETLNKPGYWAVHAAGEVWATIVLDVVAHAKEQYGFSKTLFPPATTASDEEKARFYLTEEEVASLPNGPKRKSKRPIPRHGNTLLAQLLVDGMKLQPCRPDFLSAREAIVKASQILTGGGDDYECLLRHAFAKRGLGLDAKVVGQTPWGFGVHTNGHKTPETCKGTRRRESA